MYKGKKVAALIAAGGRGQRMGSSGFKQFLNIGDKTLLEKSTEAFESSASVDSIYIILPQGYTSRDKSLGFSKIRKVIEGGETRQQSVYNGLKSIWEDKDHFTDMVLIHDAARPYINSRVIDDVMEGVFQTGGAVPAVPVKDTVKVAVDGRVVSTPDRTTLFSAQTPQGFDLRVITDAHQKAIEEGFAGTDDAQLVERIGFPVEIVAGDESNIKITTPEDMPDEGRLVGLGFDVHAFSENRDLILGGVKIPYDKGLLGHSDADVLTHALIDAILGALNLGDIGTNFPDTDQQYKDIRSTLLLEKVRDLMTQRGYTLENADLIIVAEKPKMKDHISKMRKSLAGVMKTDPDRISIKATTTEGLGFTGREEGIGAQAIIQLIERKIAE